MPSKGFAFWVALQLVLDLGLFALIIFLILKIRALGRLLAVLRPGHPDQTGEIPAGQKTGNREFRPEAGEVQKINQTPGSPPPFPQYDSQSLDPSFFAGDPDLGKSLRARVEGLAAQGLSPEDIARRLNLHPAEVKIALDLSRILAK